tara:strand:+ start:45 stop:179 length:135 start_codon:yes stop_codon:yes gene_type:complete
MREVLFALSELDKEYKTNKSIHVLRAINILEKAYPQYKIDKLEA